MTLKSILRPVSQIVSAYFNGNLTRDNFRRWVVIGYLNTVRALILCGINWVWLTKVGEGSEENLEFFNICYYGFVGYLMDIETYSQN